MVEIVDEDIDIEETQQEFTQKLRQHGHYMQSQAEHHILEIKPRTNSHPHTQDIHKNYDPDTYWFPNYGNNWEFKKAKARCTDSDKYIDISYFPNFFDTCEDTFDYYNENGVKLNMMFRKANLCKDAAG